MKNFSPIYHLLRNLLQEYRKEIGISVAQLCSSSRVSTRTYTKLGKNIIVKPECYARLVIGLCRVSSPEEFMKLWQELGERVYEETGC